MSLLSHLGGWLKPTPPLDAGDRRTIARAVASVDPLLGSVPAHERRLAPLLCQVRGYCADLVAALPGPVDIDARAFCRDPLVHACFASPDDVTDMVGRSRELRDFLAGPTVPADPFFALLAMRRREKAKMGMAMNGSVLQRDVPQRLLYFTDHTLMAVSGDLPEILRRLQELGVDSLVGSYAASLSKQRREREQLRIERGMLWAKLRGRGDADEALRQRLAAIDEALRLASEALTSERILDALVAWLAEPSAHLRLEQSTVSVDAMGVEWVPSSEGAPELPLHFSELVGRDRRRWTLLLARISRDAALLALEAQRDRGEQASRYLII